MEHLKVELKNFNGVYRPTVHFVLLHEWAMQKQKAQEWTRAVIKRFDFVEGVDFLIAGRGKAEQTWFTLPAAFAIIANCQATDRAEKVRVFLRRLYPYVESLPGTGERREDTTPPTPIIPPRQTLEGAAKHLNLDLAATFALACKAGLLMANGLPALHALEENLIELEACPIDGRAESPSLIFFTDKGLLKMKDSAKPNFQPQALPRREHVA